MLHHMFWSAVLGPLVAALAMLAVTLVTVLMLRPASVGALPGSGAAASFVSTAFASRVVA